MTKHAVVERQGNDIISSSPWYMCNSNNLVSFPFPFLVPPPPLVCLAMTEDSPAPLLTLSSLLKDRWEVVKKIGGGGFGEIYKARDIRSGEVCDSQLAN